MASITSTIPDHNPLKIGTLSAILKDIAEHFKISKKGYFKDTWQLASWGVIRTGHFKNL